MSQSTSLSVIGTPQGNSCGDCTACCDVLGIPELGKPFYSRCKHLTESGCGIYSDPARPKACDAFRCAWHAGIFGTGDDRRPDRIGLMFDLSPAEKPPRINVWEVTPGALSDERLQYLIKKMRDHKKVRGIRFGPLAVVLYPYGSKIGLRFEVAKEYPGWTQPASPTMQLRPVGPAHPDQAYFNGEIEPIRMPQIRPAQRSAKDAPISSE